MTSAVIAWAVFTLIHEIEPARPISTCHTFDCRVRDRPAATYMCAYPKDTITDHAHTHTPLPTLFDFVSAHD